MRKICILLLLLLFLGCRHKQAAPAAPPPIRLDSAAEFSVGQRSTTSLPGSEGKLLLTLDDITADQTIKE